MKWQLVINGEVMEEFDPCDSEIRFGEGEISTVDTDGDGMATYELRPQDKVELVQVFDDIIGAHI